MRSKAYYLFLIMVVAAAACSKYPPPASNAVEREAADERLVRLRNDIKKIEPFFKPMGIPGRDDWLWRFKEPGQTFDEYIASSPTLPTAERSVIYIQPLGQFTSAQQKAVDVAADYLEAFYGLPIKHLPKKEIPRKLNEPDQRFIDYPKHRQVRTGYILEEILRPALPSDAAALIGFTAEDLYPGASMYFVFGQASLENRVGVWSVFRLARPGTQLDLVKRTMKISAHEVGHMFSIRHCTKYECVMSGSNHLGETDRHPVDACPECMAKIAWMTKISPAERFERLARFARKAGFADDSNEFKRKEAAVKRAE